MNNRSTSSEFVTVKLNGVPKKIRAGTHLSSLLRELPFAARKYAVVVNGELCDSDPVLRDKDEIELISLIGGGSGDMTGDTDPLRIGDFTLGSRFLLGTGKYPSIESMKQAIERGRPAIVTVALKRIDLGHPEEDIYTALAPYPDLVIMPNTSGARTASEACRAAHIGRELSGSPFVKVEIHPDPYHLMPDPLETFEACKRLVREGFVVMPYIQPDPVLSMRLQDIGVPCVMPLGSVIGSGQGLQAASFIRIIIEQARVPVIVDAGLRSPADAAFAMELGCDAVLVNTALALSKNPGATAEAFAGVIRYARLGYQSGLMKADNNARASSPLSFLE